MTTFWNSIVGLAFVGIAMALTFLMFYLWKFPYDKALNKSSAPMSLVRVHRLLGYVYVIMYIYLMYQMVPRLWSYQIELPTRTVVHLTLGLSIGIILVIKIAIVRYYKHMEAKLVPFLGVALLICSMLLIFLALPFSLREVYLNTQALAGDDAMTMERIQRVRDQLPNAGIEDAATVERLATRSSLNSGRDVLMNKCTQCHDLRTVLARPRTPDSWFQTVRRMANRSTVLNPIPEEDQLLVTAYLIAISPTLQKTLADRRHQATDAAKMQKNSLSKAMDMMGEQASGEEKTFTAEQAKSAFENRCSQCHAFTQIENAPPANRDAANQLVQRMIGHGLTVSSDELEQIIEHISSTYVDASATSSTAEVNTPSAADQDATDGLDGETLYAQNACISCHGVAGLAPVVATYPVLGGQNSAYLTQQIKDIKSGARNSGLASIMQGVVLNLTDAEIDAISGYLAAQQP